MRRFSYDRPMPRGHLRSALMAWLAASVAAFSALDVHLSAQTNTGEIAGVVRDVQGGVLPGVVVAAVHLESGTRIERTTNSQGRYLLPSLRIGTYSIISQLSGFKRATRSDVTIMLGQQLQIDLVMEVGGVAEEVTVVAEAPLLQATTAEISAVVTQREMAEIPLNGRHFLALAQLSDGVVIPPGGTRGDALQQAGPLPSVGGQRSGHNIYLLDGVKVTDELFNNLVIEPSVDSIQELKIQKSQYAAEFGGKASALINVATRAGANAAHGSAFEFMRHDTLDAHNYFDPKDQGVPPLRQNQFGGALGGPLARDKTFYFVSYEGQRTRRSQTRTFSVPSLAMRSGDFSGFGAMCDPGTNALVATACVPFAQNQIPPERIDPIAAALLERVPAPTSSAPFQNLTSIEEQIKDVDQISVRLDQRLRTSDQMFARFSTFDADENQPFGTSSLQETLLPGFGRQLGTKARNLGVSYTTLFGSSLLNEFRFGWMSVEGGQVSQNRGVDFAARVGLQGVTRDPRDAGYPQISTRGLYSTFGDPTSFVFRDNQHVELYDNLMLDRGSHRVKLGGYFFHLRFRPEQPDNARGAFTYTGQFTGNAFADFLLGYPTSAVSGVGRGDEDGRTNWLHLFVQDDWRARRNLTLNAGLRYEYNQHMHDVNNRLSTVDSLAPGGRFVIASDDHGNISPDASALLPLIPIPYVTSAEAGWDRGLLSPSSVRLAPRTGLALSLNDGRSVLRGGYGIFLNQWAYSVQTAFARNLPFFFTRQVDVPVDARVPAFQTRNILTSDPTVAVAPTIMDHTYAVEYTQTWSAGLQHELLPSTMVEASYMGSWTLGADNATVHNVPEPGPGAIAPRRPIPQLGAIRSIRFDGRSTYHALTLKTKHIPKNGFSYNVSYTLSASKDDASSPGPTEAEANIPQNVRNIFDSSTGSGSPRAELGGGDSGEWAYSSFDHRHAIVASAMYQLPFGVRLNGTFTAQSGSPFTVNLGVDQANIGAGPAQRPNQLRDPNLAGGDRSVERWFDTSAFALPAPYSFGSAPRNSVVGPGYASVDLAIARTWTARAASHIELRVEIFNLLNRTNLDLPNRTFGTPNFGRIFSARNAREIQLGVKGSF